MSKSQPGRTVSKKPFDTQDHNVLILNMGLQIVLILTPMNLRLAGYLTGWLAGFKVGAYPKYLLLTQAFCVLVQIKSI